MLTAYIPTLALAAKGISFLYINKVTVPITQYPSPKFGSVKFWNTRKPIDKRKNNATLLFSLFKNGPNINF